MQLLSNQSVNNLCLNRYKTCIGTLNVLRAGKSRTDGEERLRACNIAAKSIGDFPGLRNATFDRVVTENV